MPTVTKLDPETPLHVHPLSLISLVFFSMGMLVNAPIDMHVIAAPVLNNNLQDNPQASS
jgi:hypothetical protein